eukprot:6521021-Lingulodinium_polyedra.AAC.1
MTRTYYCRKPFEPELQSLARDGGLLVVLAWLAAVVLGWPVGHRHRLELSGRATVVRARRRLNRRGRRGETPSRGRQRHAPPLRPRGGRLLHLAHGE